VSNEAALTVAAAAAAVAVAVAAAGNDAHVQLIATRDVWHLAANGNQVPPTGSYRPTRSGAIMERGLADEVGIRLGQTTKTKCSQTERDGSCKGPTIWYARRPMDVLPEDIIICYGSCFRCRPAYTTDNCAAQFLNM
jgi:hypothetical protein